MQKASLWAANSLHPRREQGTWWTVPSIGGSGFTRPSSFTLMNRNLVCVLKKKKKESLRTPTSYIFKSVLNIHECLRGLLSANIKWKKRTKKTKQKKQLMDLKLERKAKSNRKKDIRKGENEKNEGKWNLKYIRS